MFENDEPILNNIAQLIRIIIQDEVECKNTTVPVPEVRLKNFSSKEGLPPPRAPPKYEKNGVKNKVKLAKI